MKWNFFSHKKIKIVSENQELSADDQEILKIKRKNPPILQCSDFVDQKACLRLPKSILVLL